VTLDEMEQAALASIAKREELRKAHPGIFDSPACMTLVLKRQNRRGERMRLTPRSGPMGSILAEPNDTESLVSFNAEEVLAWARKTKKSITGP